MRDNRESKQSKRDSLNEMPHFWIKAISADAIIWIVIIVAIYHG